MHFLASDVRLSTWREGFEGQGYVDKLSRLSAKPRKNLGPEDLNHPCDILSTRVERHVLDTQIGNSLQLLYTIAHGAAQSQLVD